MWTGSTEFENDWSISARRTRLPGSWSLCLTPSPTSRLGYFKKHFKRTGLAVRRTHYHPIFRQDTQWRGTKSSHDARLRVRQFTVCNGFSESTWPRSSSFSGYWSLWKCVEPVLRQRHWLLGSIGTLHWPRTHRGWLSIGHRRHNKKTDAIERRGHDRGVLGCPISPSPGMFGSDVYNNAQVYCWP